jgi:L-aspartate oxidase
VPAAASTPPRADLAVVGAGAAGLFCALVAAREGARVALISRSPLANASSWWAQGGMSAALALEDSPERHGADTLTAGRGAARPAAVRVLSEEAPERVHELQRLGVRFDADRRGALALGLEGGHSTRRVVHAGGAATGMRITHQLSELAATHERIDVLEGSEAVALLGGDRCCGVLAGGPAGSRAIGCRAVVLATGGAAALWIRTTNPRGATGAGLLLAHAAGADLADLELCQFHPTALVSDGPRDGFLITEAVRGEGATLLGDGGERFVDELAPRDEVALAIRAQLQSTGARAVAIDLRELDLARFPNITAALAEEGIDPARETVPVAPAAHYTMGGVATDVDGRASLAGLLAIGECACTGLHGANRLASNSLAECFVFARRAALAALDMPHAGHAPGVPDPAPPATAAPSARTREAVWRDAGLLREPDGLRRLGTDPDPLARLVAASCLVRGESRGAHQRVDLPATDPALHGCHVVLDGSEQARIEHWE